MDFAKFVHLKSKFDVSGMQNHSGFTKNIDTILFLSSLKKHALWKIFLKADVISAKDSPLVSFPCQSNFFHLWHFTLRGRPMIDSGHCILTLPFSRALTYTYGWTYVSRAMYARIHLVALFFILLELWVLSGYLANFWYGWVNTLNPAH